MATAVFKTGGKAPHDLHVVYGTSDGTPFPEGLKVMKDIPEGHRGNLLVNKGDKVNAEVARLAKKLEK